MDTNTRLLAAVAVPVKVREQIKKAENYIKVDSGMFKFCIAPNDLNVLLIWAESALEQAVQIERTYNENTSSTPLDDEGRP